MRDFVALSNDLHAALLPQVPRGSPKVQRHVLNGGRRACVGTGCEDMRPENCVCRHVKCAGTRCCHTFRERGEKRDTELRGSSISSPNFWLFRLEVLCAALGASLVHRWVRGEPQTQEEKANAQWLRHPLLLHGGVQSVGRSRTTPLAAALKALKDNVDPRDTQELSATIRMRLSDVDVAPSRGGPRMTSVDRLPLSLESAAAEPWGATLMVQLCRGPPSQAARALASAMKRVVPEDQGREQSTNEAVWAAAAAVVHHAGLALEASQVARAEIEGRKPSAARGFRNSFVGRRHTPDEAAIISPALIRAWRSAQQARFWLQSGSAVGRDKKLLIWRASFLLLLEPWALTARGQRSLEQVSSIPSPGRSSLSAGIDASEECAPGRMACASSGVNVSVGRSIVASELVLQFLLRPGGSVATPAGSRETEGSNTANDNGTLLAADERVGDPSVLLSIIELRSVRAMARAKGFSLAEQLLEAMHSNDASAEVLRAVADGLMMACLGAGAAKESTPVQKSGGGEQNAEATNFSNVNHEDGRSGGSSLEGSRPQPEGRGSDSSPNGSIHYLTGVHCCDTRSKTVLVEAVANFLRRATHTLGREKVIVEEGYDDNACRGGGGARRCSKHRNCASFQSLRNIRVQALRAMCMHYGRHDHSILHRSELLPRVVPLLDDSDPFVAAAAAEVMQELYRCAAAATETEDEIFTGKRSDSNGTNRRGGSIATGEGAIGTASSSSRDRTLTTTNSVTTTFQEIFLAAVRGRVQEMVNADKAQMHSVSTRAESKLATVRVPSGGPAGARTLLDRPLSLCSSQAGLVMPHFPLSTRHTLSFWLFIPQEERFSVEGKKGVETVGAVEEAPRIADPQELANSPTGLYMVVYGSTCEVRQTPGLSSPVVGTLNGGEELEVIAPESLWATHPLVVERRCVRLAWPFPGYASLYTEDGSVLLRRHPYAQNPSAGRTRPPAGAPSLPCVGWPGESGGEDEEVEAIPVLPSPAPAGAENGGTPLRIHVPQRSVPSGPDVKHGAPREDHSYERGTGPERGTPVGGILLFKGNEVLFGENEVVDSWNRLGVEVTSSGALRFFVGEGDSSESAVCSADGIMIPDAAVAKKPNPHHLSRVAPGWFHVAVVQDLSAVSLFVNGRQCGMGSLPRRLLRRSPPEYRMAVKEVESSHPHPRSADEIWEVHIPGAQSITIKFDSNSRTELEHVFVRFYKDHARTQVSKIEKFMSRGTLSPDGTT